MKTIHKQYLIGRCSDKLKLLIYDSIQKFNQKKVGKYRRGQLQLVNVSLYECITHYFLELTFQQGKSRYISKKEHPRREMFKYADFRKLFKVIKEYELVKTER